MQVTVSLLQGPPKRFIGSELMTLRMVKALQGRGHQVQVMVRDFPEPWRWEGLSFVPETEPHGVLIYHPDYSRLADEYAGPKVAVCHNARIGVTVGLYNTKPAIVTVNSKAMQDTLGGVVVHPPIGHAEKVSGDRVAIVNLDQNKIGPFWKIAAQMPNTKFLAVRGGYGRQLEGRRTNTEIIDHVPFSAMRDKVWARTRILLVPSRSESWSMTATEAMAHGIPVIATSLPGLVENLGYAGNFAPVHDTRAWVRAINRVNDDWDHWSNLAYKRAAEITAQHETELDQWCQKVEELC